MPTNVRPYLEYVDADTFQKEFKGWEVILLSKMNLKPNKVEKADPRTLTEIKEAIKSSLKTLKTIKAKYRTKNNLPS